MRKTFASIDDALFECVFQPFSDLLIDRIGISRGTAACIGIDCASLAWIASRVPGLSGAVIQWDATAAFLDLLLLLLGLIALVSLRTMFRRARGKQANPLRLVMQPHRAIVLLMLAARLVQLQAPGLTDAADLAMLLCATAALYLGACTERPPVRRASPAFLPAA
jgi:hypothetical protein